MLAYKSSLCEREINKDTINSQGMAIAPELTVAPHDEYLKSSRVRSFSTASESSSEATPSLTSDEFRRLHIEQGLSMDLGSERDHVADIFGCIGSPSPDYEDDDDRNRHDTSRISNDGECPISDTFWSCDPSVGVTIQMGGAGAAAETPLTIFDMFHRTLAINGDNIALSVKRAGKWIKWTYSQYYQSCINVAKAFIKLGLEQYHGVCILGFNSPEWHISNMAAIMAGGIPVGLYLTNTAEACCYIADSNKANIIVVDNDSQLQKIMQIRPRLTHLKAVIFYGKIFTNKEEGIIDVS
jgi:long-chain-fatty-acid--CoA ligase ACSBG